MDFSKFGITFKPLNHDNLEMVRVWRNSDDVRIFMQFQEIITAEQQVNWFINLDKTKNFYFVAYKDGKSFGVFNIKDVDFEKMTGESGVFLKNKDSWEGDAGMRGALVLINFAFENLKLEKLICHVLKTNLKVLTFNKYLGFNISKSDSESISYELILNRLDFYNNKKIIKLLKYLAIN
ncbi:GNAT family N-acetyltransferase [Flavobacterium sp. F-380]|uniref:GNAT family N-acetyltransferase n=1 Tax=Flavobacterium kayseriense TaxID=2764714 RepID=A0ABR7J7K9_9FLAO|nr:GNAT family N-acetyltransferase [Flavobacterium kayseriense]MBC5841486.1 GNAT family N-acetyltransferase [Flavobacterium kayseriense]MBC5848014.1 GNAT family N-acetyltransferase [Flavobacterium kayseriense]